MGRRLTFLLFLAATCGSRPAMADARQVFLRGNLTACPSMEEVKARVSGMATGFRLRLGTGGRGARSVQLTRSASGLVVRIDGRRTATLPARGDQLCERRLAGIANIIANALVPSLLDVAEPHSGETHALENEQTGSRFGGSLVEEQPLSDVHDLAALGSQGASPPNAPEGVVAGTREGGATVAARPTSRSSPQLASTSGAAGMALPRMSPSAVSLDIFGAFFLLLECGSCERGWGSAVELGAGLRAFYWPTDAVAVGLGVRGSTGALLSAQAREFVLRRFPVDLSFRWLAAASPRLQLTWDIGGEVVLAEFEQGTTREFRIEGGGRTGLQLNIRNSFLIGIDLQILAGNQLHRDSADRAPAVVTSLCIGLPLAL